jgi:hypothetical protein
MSKEATRQQLKLLGQKSLGGKGGSLRAMLERQIFSGRENIKMERGHKLKKNKLGKTNYKVEENVGL